MNYIVWMCGTLLSFCLLAVAARELSGELSIFQMLFVRSAIGLFFVLIILKVTHQFPTLKSQRVGFHIFRNIFHFFGQYGWFIGIALLPLAEVFALEFTVPIWTAILAMLFLNERMNARKVIAIVLGSIGVLIIVQPGYAIVDPASFIVLAAALCFAISHTTTKYLSTSESPMSILFYMCAIQLPIGLFLSINNWVWPSILQWCWLVVIGVASLTAHYCMTKAMALTDVTKVMIVDFMRLPLITLVGVLFYQEKFEYALLLGGLLMLSGNLIMATRKN